MLLRLLTEGAAAPGSPARKGPVDGNYIFPAGPGNIEPIKLDFTGWLGSATISSHSFTASDVTLASVAASGGVVTALATIPASPTEVPYNADPSSYQVVHSCTASDGRRRVTTFYLATE